MRRSIAGLLATLALAVPAAAQAQALSPADAFAMFDRACLATHGDRTLALQAMDANGWIVAPPAMMPQTPAGFTNLEARLGSTPTAMLVGFVAEAASPGESGPIPVCSLTVAPSLAGVDEQLAAWAGGDPARSAAGMHMYLFRTDRGGHEAVLDLPDDEALALARAGHLFMVVVQTEARGTMLMRTNFPY